MAEVFFDQVAPALEEGVVGVAGEEVELAVGDKLGEFLAHVGRGFGVFGAVDKEGGVGEVFAKLGGIVVHHR